MAVVKFELDQEDAETLSRLVSRGYASPVTPKTDSEARVVAYVDVQTRLGAVADATEKVGS